MSTSRLQDRTRRAVSLAVTALAAVAVLAPAVAPADAGVRAADRRAGPVGRTWDSWAYYPPGHDVVLFGGNKGHGSSVGGPSLGRTWTWSAAGWVRQAPANSPSARTGAAMAYDPAAHQLVLFGGSTGPESGFQNDTWTWNGTTWTRLQTAGSPPARHNADLFYDPARRELILFGGYDGHYLNDTWAWNGGEWIVVDLVTPPPSPRDTGPMVYDNAAKAAILFGGYNGDRLSDTWSWADGTWTQLDPATSPGAVSAAWQATYDAHTGQLLLFGGDPGGGPLSDITWVWNGTTWAQQHPARSPLGRGYGALTYDSQMKQVVMFGGTIGSRDPANIWAWNGTNWHHP